MVNGIELAFPGLRTGNYTITSPKSDEYNCIAWAAGFTNAWWWPEDPKGEWPPDVPVSETVESFRLAFVTQGYVVCSNDDLESGFEKIALFANFDGMPTHAARQLPSGRWTSKLGLLEDIEHDLRDLEGDAYGTVVLLMRRAASPSISSS